LAGAELGREIVHAWCEVKDRNSLKKFEGYMMMILKCCILLQLNGSLEEGGGGGEGGGQQGYPKTKKR
jgi:hypothetical protein